MRSLIAISLLLAPLSIAAAQTHGSTELGLGITSLGLTTGGGGSFFSLTTSQEVLSFGFYLSPSVAIAPSIGGTVLAGVGGAVSQIQLGIAVPFFLRPTWGHTGTYVAPSLGLIKAGDSGESAQQVFAGLKVGERVRIGDQVSLDLGVALTHSFSNNDYPVAITSVNGQLGVSVFFH